MKLKALGANTVRIFVTFGSFHMEQGKLDEIGMVKFEEFLLIAEKVGLYVQPTGLEGWEGVPDCMNREGGRGDQADRFADEANFQMQENFWRQFAGRFRGRPIILAYELQNEPAVRWSTPSMDLKWRQWCSRRYGSLESLRRLGKMRVMTCFPSRL